MRVEREGGREGRGGDGDRDGETVGLLGGGRKGEREGVGWGGLAMGVADAWIGG